jgi:uncharacterized phiE125 gp8 family phage protein
MPYGISVITPPAQEPVDLDLLKTMVGANTEDEDALLSHFARSARETFERMAGVSIITQTLKLSLNSWTRNELYTPWRSVVYPYLTPSSLGTVYLPKPPLVSVSSVQYYDTANALQTLSSTNYSVITDQRPGLLKLNPQVVWPILSTTKFPKVLITYVAGNTADQVPSAIRQAILAQAASWYVNRDTSTLAPGFITLVNTWRADFAADLMEDTFAQRWY